MVTLYFGLELDDIVYTQQPDNQEVVGGAFYAGSQKLLLFLETHLALARHLTNNEHLRIEAYRQTLQRHVVHHPDSFYATSFEADQLATAAALLQRRDELLLANWDFQLEINLPPRLRTLAEVEQYLKTQQSSGLEVGFADRFAAVVAALKDRPVPIQKIFLQTPFDLLPKHFQRLFEGFKQNGILLETLEIASFEGDSDLNIFQKALREKQNGSRTKITPKQDGSLVILKAKRETDAATFVAKLLHLNPTFKPLCVIPQKNQVLANALIQEGLPSLGIQSASLARPVLQILKLVPAFLWQPIDPYKIMEFVSLAVKPLDSDLAEVIASEVAQTPGLQGERWNIALRNFFEDLSNRAANDPSIQVEKVREAYNFWFNRRRYDSSATAPKREAIQIFERVARWARETFDTSKQASLLVLSEQARRIVELLEALPETEPDLTSLQLERIVRTIYEPSPITFVERQVGSLPFVHATSAILTPTEDLVWWNFVEDEPNYFFARWYPTERAFLSKAGVELESPKDENDRLLWQRPIPILQTQKRAILVIPAHIQGKETNFHPLWSDLSATFKNLELLCVDVPNTAPQPVLRGWELPAQVEQSYRQIGKPAPYLQLSPAYCPLSPREEETFTSLEDLLYYPHKWFFQHQLYLRNTSILSVVGDDTLMGNLAHRLFENLFKNHGDEVLQWDKKQLESWVKTRIDQLLEREGAVLLMYGREPEKLNFIHTIQYAAWSLIHILKNNGWKIKETEASLEGHLREIKLKGKADLVLENAQGERAIIDLKWKGERWRQQLIKNEEDLQLIFYAKLLSSEWSHTAFFILKTGKMLARNQQAFKEAVAVTDLADFRPTNELIWKKIVATFAWRTMQLEKGILEVRSKQTYHELEDPTDSIASADLAALQQFLEMKQDDNPFDAFKTLVNLMA